jgi:type III secretory pathway component EscU
MGVVRRIRYFGVSVGALAIILGLTGAISTSTYLTLASVGTFVFIIGFLTLLVWAALAGFLLVIRAIR